MPNIIGVRLSYGISAVAVYRMVSEIVSQLLQLVKAEQFCVVYIHIAIIRIPWHRFK